MQHNAAWDEEAAGMPDPWAHLRPTGLNPYGPEGEILQVRHFASGIRRATGWRRIVGLGVTGLLLVSLLGSAVVSAVELALPGHAPVVPNQPHVP